MPDGTLLVVMSWQECVDVAPEFAQRIRARFDAAEIHVPATLPRDALVVTMWRAGQPLVRFERPGNGRVVRIEL